MIEEEDRAAFEAFMARVDQIVDRASGGIGMTHEDFADANWAELFNDIVVDCGTGPGICTDDDIIEHLAEYDSAFAMNVEAAKALAAAGDLAVLP